MYRELIAKFNQNHKALRWSQLLIQDMQNQKFEFNTYDYQNLIAAHRMNPAHIIRIYKNLTADEKVIIDTKIMKQFLKVVQINDTQMAEFYEKLMKEYILSKRMPVTIDIVNEINKVFCKIRNNTLFTEFIDFLHESDLQFNQTIDYQSKLFNEVLKIYTKDNKQLANTISGLYSQERSSRIKKSKQNMTDE